MNRCSMERSSCFKSREYFWVFQILWITWNVSNPMIKHHFVLLLRTITLYFSVVDQLRQKSVCQKMLEFLKYTCTENGYLISCFQNFGKVKNSNECRRRCDANNLYQLGVNDFYNFHERLHQTNFFVKAKDVSFIPDVTSMCDIRFFVSFRIYMGWNIELKRLVQHLQ